MSRGLIVTLAAAFGAGLAGGGVAVLAGSGDSRTTTVTVSAVTARAPETPVVTAAVARVTAGSFDAPAIYRAASAGVVTISAVVGGDAVDGSGFVVSGEGHVITNAHVVTDSPDHGTDSSSRVKAGHDFFVHFQDGNSVPATLVGFDLFDDVAVLKVDPTREPLTVLRFGAARQLKVGDPLAVIGSPFGEEQQQSLSVGVVAAVNREIDAPATDFTTPGVIQTDAAINHGNSGGPVLDRAGRVVGVAAQILTDGSDNAWTGIGFAVPAEAAKRSYTELVDHGKVSYAWLGVATRPINRELARSFELPVTDGLLVNGVTPGGPAADAGLTAGTRTADFQDDGVVHPGGDIVVTFAGQEVRTPAELGAIVALAEPGSVVPVEIYRAGKRRTVQVTLGNRPARLPG
jgi:2-alkenal reductase